jgi:hypothetical protein
MYAASTAAARRASLDADGGCRPGVLVTGLVLSLVLWDIALSFCS